MRRRSPPDSARSFPPSSRRPASITSKPPSGAERSSTRLIRMLRNGTISQVRSGSAARCSRSWSRGMGEFVIRLPDVGEGVAEAELVEWQVKVGDLVREDTILGAVMTDKATVEIPSPVEGEVLWLGGEIGDVIAVGSELVRLTAPGEDNRSAA